MLKGLELIDGTVLKGKAPRTHAMHSVADHVGRALFSSGPLCSLLPLTFRQLVKRRIVAFLLVLVQRDFEFLSIVVSDPDGIVSDPAVHNPANALCCHAKCPMLLRRQYNAGLIENHVKKKIEMQAETVPLFASAMVPNVPNAVARRELLDF